MMGYGKNNYQESQLKFLAHQVHDFVNWGVPTTPSAPGYKSPKGCDKALATDDTLVPTHISAHFFDTVLGTVDTE